MSFTGLKTINATDINNQGEIRLTSDLEAGTNGQVIISQGEGQPAIWGSNSVSLPNALTMGTDLSLASGNSTFDGSIPDTINAAGHGFGSGGNGIDITGTVITTDNDGTTINNTGGTGTQNQVLKVPNALTAGTNITFSSGTTYDGSTAITISSTDNDNQLNLTAALPMIINNLGGLNKQVELQYDTNTLGAGGGALEVLKVPNTLTAGTNISFSSGTTYDGSTAITISSTDNDNQLNLTEGNGITITNTGGLNRTIALNADSTTLSNNVGSGQAGVLKVPNVLTKGTNISFINTTDGAVETSYDGSTPITISSTDTNTTYQGGKNITIDTTTNPDTINLDDDLTGIDSITFTSTAGTTALTGNNYPSNPTPMTNFDLSSTTNIFPKFSPAIAAGVGGLGGIYRDVANGFLYRFLLPSDFLNDNDSSGYARSVISDSFNHGSMQCYAGSQYYAFFTIPDGYYFSGFRVNLVNSSGTAQGSTPTSSFYVDVRTKNINSNLVQVGTTKGFNTDNLGYTITSGYSAGWDINDSITIGAIHCFRNPWSSSFYNRGGWIQYTEGTPGGGGGGGK
tara:strand:+ start:699 stop:2405 length:1707 start_codon:yes stop_codon:yes gene_type:complete